MTFPAPRWSENQWRSEFSLLAMSGYASTWLAQGEATWWYMKHGHTSKGYDMPWGSEFLRTIDCIKAWSMMFVKLMTFKTSLFAKLWRHAASCALHSDPLAQHSARTALSAPPASPSDCGVISMTKSGRCCITSNSGPRSAMPQHMNLNEI